MQNWIQIPNLTSKTCFGCGPANPHGLKMVFFSNGKEVKSETRIPHHMVGWSSLAHGGVISTILDEVMAWTAIYLKQSFILTKTLSVDFLKPILIESDILAKGYIESEIIKKGRTECNVVGEIFDKENRILARGIAKMPLFTKESMIQLGLFEKEYIEEFDRVVLQGNKE